jgi:hypothetical protein
MTWVKTNFLWMMYRSKWGTKHDQQRTLAVWIKRSSFEQLMSRAVVNKSHEEMKAGEKYKKPKGARGTVRLQWDPDHRPDGSEVRNYPIDNIVISLLSSAALANTRYYSLFTLFL